MKWAKISEKRFLARYNMLEEMTQKELKQFHDSLKAIYDGSFRDLRKVWALLPEAQWEMTFAQKMKHLPEYRDLLSALKTFKHQYLGTKPKVADNAESPTKSSSDQVIS